jgi:hypothetical protein
MALEVFNIFFPPVGDLITVPVSRLGVPDSSSRTNTLLRTLGASKMITGRIF